jgi:DNA-binding CsgD family transcriptional regulator
MQHGSVVNKTDSDILAKIKKSLKACLAQLENEPIILIDAKGKYWVNSFARKIISKRGISIEDFTEWIRVGSSHLQDVSHRDIHVHMCRLRKKEVIAFLKLEPKYSDTVKKIDLTEKQKEILRYVLGGFSNKEIADRMRISPGTVNSHLDNIYLKLRCSSRLEASLIALKDGLFLRSREVLSKERGRYK